MTTVEEQCSQFRANSSSGYRRLVARTMVARILYYTPGGQDHAGQEPQGQGLHRGAQEEVGGDAACQLP